MMHQYEKEGLVFSQIKKKDIAAYSILEISNKIVLLGPLPSPGPTMHKVKLFSCRKNSLHADLHAREARRVFKSKVSLPFKPK